MRSEGIYLCEEILIPLLMAQSELKSPCATNLGISKTHRRDRNHLVFFLRCRDKKIVHKGLRIKLPIVTEKAKQLVFRTFMALVREHIGVARRTLHHS